MKTKCLPCAQLWIKNVSAINVYLLKMVYFNFRVYLKDWTLKNKCPPNLVKKLQDQE